MNWNTRFAERTGAMKRSAVRELLKLTAGPDMISFAGGLPAPELFPMARVQKAIDRILTQAGPVALQYNQTEGLPELRDWIAAHYSTQKVRWARDNVLIVSGGQQGLDLIGRVLLDPDDAVVVPNPVYLALLSAWRPLGVRFLPVSLDTDGPEAQSFRAAISRKPKALYLVPNFSNPQGTTLSRDARRALLDRLAQTHIALIEDDPYGDLRYSGDPLPSLIALEAESAPDVNSGRVIHVGTFSKTLMPGLRVGWVLAAAEVIDKLVQAKQSADLHTSTFNQHIVLDLVRDGFLEGHVRTLCQQYGQRRDAMLEALESSLAGAAQWTVPEGGMFLFLTLPEGGNAVDLLESALQEKVAFVPGNEFHLDGAGQNTMRLNFTNTSRIAEGVQRLARAIEKQSERCTAGGGR